jgi:hypothetical protein
LGEGLPIFARLSFFPCVAMVSRFFSAGAPAFSGVCGAAFGDPCCPQHAGLDPVKRQFFWFDFYFTYWIKSCKRLTNRSRSPDLSRIENIFGA